MSDENRTVVEHTAAAANMDLVISERVVRDEEAGEITVYRREWAWNYVDEEYREERYSFDFELAADGVTVDHAGVPWDEYAEAKMATTIGHRRLDPDTHTRTVEA